MMNIYAHTEAQYKSYPAYISVNKRSNGAIEFSVRSREAQSAGVIELTPEQCEALAVALIAHINGENK